MNLFPMYLNWCKQTLKETKIKVVFIKTIQHIKKVFGEQAPDFFFVSDCQCSCAHSINVKKSISSEGVALFQYAKRASEKGGSRVDVMGRKGGKRVRHCACLRANSHSYPPTCSWGCAGSTWGGSWSRLCPACHSAARRCPAPTHTGSGGGREGSRGKIRSFIIWGSEWWCADREHHSSHTTSEKMNVKADFSLFLFVKHTEQKAPLPR